MTKVIRQEARPDPELAIFKHGFFAGLFVALIFFGLVCSICSVRIVFP